MTPDQLPDANAALSLRIITDREGKRPAETDMARIKWLCSSRALADIVGESEIHADPPTQVPEIDYRGQRADDVLTDCAEAAGKTFFAYWSVLKTAPVIGLFYGDKELHMTETEPIQAPDDTPAEPADDVVSEPPKPTEPETPKP